MDIGALQPAMYKAMISLDRAIGQNRLPPAMIELVKLRASQINGCVYCVDLHSTDAKKAGESDVRLHGVAVWPEAGYYTEAERAALALTESMTRLPDPGDRVPQPVWDEARRHFDHGELAALVMAITMINAWNRIGVATRMTPENGIELA
jgi:AhpD family alkylhydroperoxidase